MERRATGVRLDGKSRIPLLLFTCSLALLACDLTDLMPALPTSETLISTPFWDQPTLPSPLGGTMNWVQGPVPIGESLEVGNLEIGVNHFQRPADSAVMRADSHPIPERSEHFAIVDVSATCLADPGDTCTVTELNFSIGGSSGEVYYPSFSSSLQGLSGLFEGGSIPAGETQSGDIVFILDRDAEGLTLTFTSVPGGLGPFGSFTLEP